MDQRDERRMPGQSMPTWLITALVVCLTLFFAGFVLWEIAA